MRALIEAAVAAKESAYAPYSGFRVGAALLAENGRIYRGVNVESASYGATICAERGCVAAAVADGQRHFTAIAVASDSEAYTMPCGICRQVLAEFGDMDVICVNGAGEARTYRLSELLPYHFQLEKE